LRKSKRLSISCRRGIWQNWLRIARRDKLAWDKEIEEDFSRGGKHGKTLEKIDTQIDAGNFTPIP